MRSGDWGWLAVGGVAFGYEGIALVKGWPLLSEAMDGYRTANRVTRVAVPVAIFYLAGHLTRRWPPKLDPLTVLSSALGK